MSQVCRPGVLGSSLLIVLLSGLCSGLHLYKFIDEPMTWNEAQQYCREKFSDLATLDSMEDVDQLLAAAGSGYTGKAWIGLYDNPSSWAWSMKDDRYYGNNDEFFLQWGPNEPGDDRDEWKLCTVVKTERLDALPCTPNNPFLCYDNTNASAPPAYVFRLQWNMNWEGAQTYCRQFHTDLASSRNEEEWTQILQAIPAGNSAYVGLYRRTWYSWSDGSEHEFKNFLSGYPTAKTGDCAASLIESDTADAGKWIEDHCDQKLPFVCNYEEKHQLRIKLRFLKSAVDLNDPTVTEAILKVLEKKMKEKGIEAGFKLRWVKKSNNTVFQEEKDEL